MDDWRKSSDAYGLAAYQSAFGRSLDGLKNELHRRRFLAQSGNPRTRAANSSVVVTNTGSTEFNANVYQRTPNAPAAATDWAPYCVFEGGWTYYTSNRVYVYASTRTDPSTAGGIIPTGGGPSSSFQSVGVMRTIFTGQIARFNLNGGATGQKAYFLVGKTEWDLQFTDFTGMSLNTGYNFITIDFGSSDTWFIEVRVSGGAVTSGGSANNATGFGRLYPTKTDTFRAPRTRPQLAVYGDSYTMGRFISSGNSTAYTNYDISFARIAGDFLGIGVQASGVGGSGYKLRSSTSNLPSLQDRILDVGYGNVDIIATAFGINDAPYIGSTFTQTELEAAMDASISLMRLQNPGKPIVMFGPWMGSTGQTNIPTVQTSVQTRVAALNDPRFLFVPTYNSDNKLAYQFGIGKTTSAFSGTLTFTGSLSSATSGTLNAAFAGQNSSSYILLFSDGTAKTGVTLTNGSTSVSWTGAVTASASVIYSHPSSAGTNDAEILADGTHLTDAGHARIGRRFASDLYASIMLMS